MLFEKTVEPRTMALLRELSQVPLLQQFGLAGGTNLSLRYGYRMSIDLDFFSTTEFDEKMIAEYLAQHYTSFRPKMFQANTLTCFVNDIKVDFIMQKAQLIQEYEIIDGIRFYSVPDVCGMKCSAILGRGVKKDYRDMAHLLKYYNIADFLDFFQKKYPRGDVGTVIRSLSYLDDAEKDKADVNALDDMTRSKVKKTIQQGVREYFMNNL